MNKIMLLFIVAAIIIANNSGAVLNVSDGTYIGDILIYSQETGGELRALLKGVSINISGGRAVGIEGIIPEYLGGDGYWIELDIDGVAAMSERIAVSSRGSLRRESPAEGSEIEEDMSIEMRIGNPGEDFMVESDRTGFGDPAPNERVTVAGAMSMQGLGSTPTAESGYGKVFVDDSNGHLMYVKEDGAVTDLTVDGNAVQSVSSSANPTGRTEHMRFIPGEMTEITESATNDTIYIRYDLSMSSTGCSSAPSQPDPIDGITPICSGEPGTSYGVAPVDGASYYRWTVPSGATITDGFGTNIIHAILGDNDGDICVRAVNACGESSSRCFGVTINRPTAPGSISGDFLVCNDTTGLTYSIAAVPEATSYIWTVPPGAVITGGSSTNEITVNFGTTDGEICVQTENSCGRSEAVCASIVMTETPATPGSITGTSSLCQYTSASYSISSVPEATGYVWTVPSGASITSGGGTTTIDVLFGTASGNVGVAAQSICGTSGVRNFAVTVINPPPTPGAISGDMVVPPGSTGEVYTISAVSGANPTGYNWYITSGDASIVSSTNTTSVTINFGSTPGPVELCVTASNSCGVSSPRCATILNSVPSGNQTFNYSGTIQTFTVPEYVYEITVDCRGAEGGNRGTSCVYGEIPGRGARMVATLPVTPGETYRVLVGQKGGPGANYGSGGGGGSFFVRFNGSYTPYLIAGGGGGCGYACSGTANGGHGTTSTSGTAGTPTGGAGGTSGGGGFAPTTGSWRAAGGGGYSGNGGSPSVTGTGTPPTGGLSFLNGGAGGSAGSGAPYNTTGGFGGGGGSSVCGGGGGGYSGGGGGWGSGCPYSAGGGGGSYCIGSGTLTTATTGYQTGNGQIIVSWGS